MTTIYAPQRINAFPVRASEVAQSTAMTTTCAPTTIANRAKAANTREQPTHARTEMRAPTGTPAMATPAFPATSLSVMMATNAQKTNAMSTPDNVFLHRMNRSVTTEIHAVLATHASTENAPHPVSLTAKKATPAQWTFATPRKDVYTHPSLAPAKTTTHAQRMINAPMGCAPEIPSRAMMGIHAPPTAVFRAPVVPMPPFPVPATMAIHARWKICASLVNAKPAEK